MLSSSSAYCLLVTFHQLSQSYASFTTGSGTFPRESPYSAVGYDNNTNSILIFGSVDYQQQFIKFQNDAFEDMGLTYLTSFAMTRSSAQHYAQIGNKLWMVNSYGTNIFRVDTNTYNEDPHLSQYEIPSTSSLAWRTCLASLDEHYLFIVGGGDNSDAVQLYNIQNGEWLINVPSMNQIRRSLSCIVVHSTLYAIGGYTGSNSVRLATIESLNVSDLSVLSEQQWSYLNGALTQELAGTRAESYGDDILVIGGKNNNDIHTKEVHIIYTETGSCELWDNLNIEVSHSATIIVHNVLYVFSGMGSSGAINKYQYKVLPTSQPTAHPTAQPTAHVQPTAQPTLQPTGNPTVSPITLSPSLSATLLPSIYPSLAPTKSTTISPTITPLLLPTQTTELSSYSSSVLTYSSSATLSEQQNTDNMAPVYEDTDEKLLLMIVTYIVVGLFTIIIILSIIYNVRCIYFKCKKRAAISRKASATVKSEQNTFDTKQAPFTANKVQLANVESMSNNACVVEQNVAETLKFEEIDHAAEGNNNAVELEEGEFEVIGDDDDTNANTSKY